jgi:7,8-dihydropterin-6-yl-methyl-4-(beta-D-ribofuranosyl)aminobenzene 5'-phosphate synthase
VFERNVTRLGLDHKDGLGAIGALVLSHGHWDHGGAMPRALQMIAQAKGALGKGVQPKNVPVYMHPEMFALRAIKRKEGDYFPMELVPSVEILSGSGGDAVVTREEQSVLDDAFYVSGEIPRVTGFERGFPGQHRQKPDGSWEKDEIMPDERYVSVHVAGKGQIVFTACSHAGLINVLTAARARFPDVPLYGVLGGLHLSGITEAIIPETVAALAQFDLKLIAAGHCTGWRAVNALAGAFGEAVVPTAAGKRFVL